MTAKFIFALWAAPILAFAQVPQVQTQILTVALSQVPGEYFYKSGEEVRPFAAEPSGLGSPMAYKGPQVFILHTDKAAFEKLPEGQKPPVPAAFVTLPEGSDRVLIVSAPLPDQKIRLIAYDIATSKMKEGDYRFFNFSKLKLSMMLGDERALVESGSDQLLTDEAWRSKIQDLPVKMAVVQSDNKTATQVYSSLWGHRPVRRNLIFLFDGDRPNRPVQMRRFYDIIVATTEAAPQ